MLHFEGGNLKEHFVCIKYRYLRQTPKYRSKTRASEFFKASLKNSKDTQLFWPRFALFMARNCK